MEPQGDGRGWVPAQRGDIIVPRIVWEYSTRRVLVMEYLEGIKITDIAGLQREGIDTQAVAQLVIDAYCEQLYLHGMFHADPHPGNLFVQPPARRGGGPRLVMLDFGLCRQLDDKFRLGYARLVNAMLTWNIPDMVKAFLDLGVKVRNPKDTAVYLELGKGFTEVARRGGLTPTPTSSRRRTSGCRGRSGRTRSRKSRASSCSSGGWSACSAGWGSTSTRAST